jgi:hypothetical protein
VPAKDPKKSLTGWIAVVMLVGAVVFPLSILGAFAAGVGWLSMPSPGKRMADERDRRISRWRAKATTLPEGIGVEDLKELLSDFESLELVPSEGGKALEIIQGTVDFVLFKEKCIGDGVLRPIAGLQDEVGSDTCFFASGALYDRRGPNDENGVVYVTAQRILFVGDSLMSVPWKKVFTVKREDKRLLVQRNDRQNPTVFELADLGDAMKAEFIIEQVRAQL